MEVCVNCKLKGRSVSGIGVAVDLAGVARGKRWIIWAPGYIRGVCTVSDKTYPPPFPRGPYLPFSTFVCLARVKTYIIIALSALILSLKNLEAKI